QWLSHISSDLYAKAIASRGGIGVSDQIYRQILALQEV
ncbi:MAG TPA: hypothetical protein DCF61_02015, partial [Alphaproteobacteria bacterium]|nr:hypothetical protein [Alphaproteobacteria bacterium]